MKTFRWAVLGLVMMVSLQGAAARAANPLLPVAVPAPGSIRALLEQRQDYERIAVKGRVIRRVEHDELFEFSDGSASILLKVDHKHWPYPVHVGAATMFEAVGEFDYEHSGDSRLKVFDLRPVP